MSINLGLIYQLRINIDSNSNEQKQRVYSGRVALGLNSYMSIKLSWLVFNINTTTPQYNEYKLLL